MATSRMVAREKQLIRKYADQSRRDKLKSIIKDMSSTGEQVMEAMFKLQTRPIDESPIRRRRRCSCCGRSRGVYRRFSLCRMCIRKYAALGYIPGLVKSSW